MTRREMGDAAAVAMPPADAAISLEQALAGYTVNGAAQLGLEEELGAIRAGFLADFIVLPRDPFERSLSKPLQGRDCARPSRLRTTLRSTERSLRM